MRKQLLSFFTIAWVTLLISAFCVSCGGDDSSDDTGGNGGKSGSEQVFTGSVTNVTASSASISCNFTSGKSVSSLQLGVMYSTERSVVDNRQGVLCLSSNISGNAYTVELANLQSNTIYYYRAFMISEGNTYYGSVNSFTTSQGGLVNTGDVTDLTYRSVTITSSFRNNAILSYESLGVKYSESPDGFESGNYKVVTTSEVTSGNTFTIKLKNLSEQTTYYYRAYVKDYKTTYYGDIKNFTTPKNTINYYGHEYVDLGLPSGTKWATMNVGASTPEECGDYYAWGETTTKSSYTLDNYRWKGLTTEDLVSRGVVQKISDYDYTLTASYDVATLKWGSVWRMPTFKEIDELESHTNIKYTTQNGVDGFLFTSTINKKSIFLPVTGRWTDEGLIEKTLYRGWHRGTFWSASLSEYQDSYSKEYSVAIWIENDGLKNIWTFAMRYYGSTIRPVTSY
jgi:hypothetical protein